MSKDMKVSRDITESETEIIEVEDDPESPRKQDKDLGSATEGNLREKTKLCEFPAASTNSVIVCFADYMTLKPGTFLNDIMIDFYLTYIYHNLLSIANKPTVHIFSTMFYKRLVSPPTNTKTMPSYESDPSLNEVEKQHRRVKGWTKNCNLFDKNLLVIPICQSSHWYVLVVVRPGCIKYSAGSINRVNKGEPFIMVLDSLGGSNTTAVNNVRHYLAEEWKAKMYEDKLYKFSSSEMRAVTPKKPEQDNSSDCGIFLLCYVEQIFKKFTSGECKLYQPVEDIRAWFNTKKIAAKRRSIGGLIRNLSEQQKLTHLNIPDISGLSPATLTRSKENFHLQGSQEKKEVGTNMNNIGPTAAAAKFYGKRSLITSNVSFGPVGLSSKNKEYKHAREETNQSKDKIKVIGVKKSKDIETSRQVLTNKLKQIEKARTAYDELKEYKIPKKGSPCVQKEPNSYEYKFATDSNSNRGYQEGILFSGGNKKNVELENNIKSILSELQ